MPSERAREERRPCDGAGADGQQQAPVLSLCPNRAWIYAVLVLPPGVDVAGPLGAVMWQAISARTGARCGCRRTVGGGRGMASMAVLCREREEAVRQVRRRAGRQEGDAGGEGERALWALWQADAARRTLQQARDEARGEVNRVSKEMAMAASSSSEREAELRAESKRAAEKAREAGEAMEISEAECRRLFLSMPNWLQEDVPAGTTEEENVVVKQWTPPQEPRQSQHSPWHDEIAGNTMLNMSHPDQAVRLSGRGFLVLSDQLARMERALVNFFMDVHTEEHGYREISVPHIVSRDAMEGTGQLPKFGDDMFQTTHGVHGQDSFLIPTAEVALTNLFRESVLPQDALPLAFAAATPCYRAEAGSTGTDTRGFIRVHQFTKVELVRIVEPAQSDQELNNLTRHAEICLERLRLPYRRILLCAGETGFSAAKCYDLEVWFPGQQRYREVSSCSNCTDFQAQRMKLRYRATPASSSTGGKRAGKNRMAHPHTLNGSALAIGRTLAAILEHYWDAENERLEIPEALQPYMRRPTDSPPVTSFSASPLL